MGSLLFEKRLWIFFLNLSFFFFIFILFYVGFSVRAGLLVFDKKFYVLFFFWHGDGFVSAVMHLCCKIGTLALFIVAFCLCNLCDRNIFIVSFVL